MKSFHARRRRNHPVVLASTAALAVASLCSMFFQASAQPISADGAASSDWVSFRGGKLSYRADAQGNRVPDFSSVGYRGGDASIPDLPVVATLSPSARGDDTARIQAAIKRATRGAVLLRPGTYRIGGTIKLNRSGIVLRGSNGTILSGTGKAHTLIELGAKGSAGIRKTGGYYPVTDDYVPVGSAVIHVNAASSKFKAGDRIVVERPMEASWIHAIGMDRIPQRPDGGRTTQWKPVSDINFQRTIAAVRGNTITLDTPLPQALEKPYTHATVSKYTYPGRISGAGVENLTGDGKAFHSHPSWHSTGYFQSTLVSVAAAENSWVRNITARQLSSAFDIGSGALRVSILNTQSLDPGVPQDIHAQPAAYSIAGQQTLIADCRVTGSNQHAWVTQARVPGPNVITRCSATNTGSRLMDAGPHQRWASGTLYDEITMSGGGKLSISDRQWLGSGQGWAGANHVAWNCSVGSYKVEDPPTAHNWAIGCTGKQTPPSNGHNMGQIQSPGQHVLPASLYAAQLRERHAGQSDPTPTPTGTPDPTQTAKRDDPTPTPTQSQSGGNGDAGDGGEPTTEPADPDGHLPDTGSNTPIGLVASIAAALIAAGTAMAWWLSRRKTAAS
ncbi:hypothetical protein [Streptomyces sp. NPDC020681]|uniref:hypothetical protein n=1 Tax=Streptomyces sp. NPDC020681 TaxID=3365083 RepID=UPI0037893943